MNEEKILKCCFTGHRPKFLSWGYDETHTDCLRLKEIMKAEIIKLIERGVYYYISGMSEGVDMYAAEIILELKEKYPTLFLECALPYEEQATAWKNSQREKYFTIIEKSDKATLLQNIYSNDCYHKRNRYMISQAQIVLGVSKGGERSGTVSTLRNAITGGKEVIIINPLTFQVVSM